ncbi:SPW repeat protein [Actinoallomurus sp. NPDC052274]|uniref:SPW repeat protein n=1 Tax=Actinoallomurus sp. NPDC052274 TaxID=3155420 RepID=UPI00341FEBD0
MLEREHGVAEVRARYDSVAETPPAQVVNGLTFLSALYLAISAWVVGFNARVPLTVNDLIVGAALALLAIGFTSAYGRTHGLMWTTPLIGVWTIIAPWVLPRHTASTAEIVNNALTGTVIILCGLAAIGIGLMPAVRRESRF